MAALGAAVMAKGLRDRGLFEAARKEQGETKCLGSAVFVPSGNEYRHVCRDGAGRLGLPVLTSPLRSR